MRALGAIIFFAATACFVFASAIPGLATNETHWSTNTSNDAVASDDERMMPQGASKVEALERVPALGPKFKQKSSQNVGNVKKALTTVLFHKKDPLKTLKSPWVRTLEKSYDTAQLSQLFRKRYGDGATVVALAAAKESTGVTGDVANKLWEEQLKGYLAKTPRLSPKQVFKELEIPTDHRVFSDPRLSMHPERKFSLLAWLTKNIKENVLAEALVVAKRSDFTEDVAITLQKEQFEQWVQVKEPLVHAVQTLDMHSFDGKKFEKWIQVEKPLERVLDKFDKDKFEGPKVQVLDDFIEFYNKKRPRNDQLSLLAALISKFGGDIRLMELLQSAEVDASSVVKAFEVEELLYTKWTTFHFNPADLLMLLKVPQGLEALENPYLAMVLEYSHKYNKKHAHKKFLLVDWFTQKIKEKDLAEALVKARKVKATESIATELQTELLNNWLIHGKSIDDVRKLLQLDRAGDAVPRNPPPMGNTP
ncbi:hypothetical protein PsorP6_006708 [Peronosclerospora sorghi]|uniref:Uncharacterized protein n=1 Tax=Peronosclerospora sorghi TaxID=230839 RepID=A0ACC0W1E0_9STRA|nr:hypothetical protein PsorP6_006708 [Peronosclerospora sorghi]